MSSAPGARMKRMLLAASALASGMGVLSWSQEWIGFSYRVDAGSVPAAAMGDAAASPLLTLSLAGLACIAGLALAGPIMRRVIGTLQILLGVTIGLTSLAALLDPVRAVLPVITKHTGIEGVASTAALIEPGTVRLTGWPWLALATAAALILIGVSVLRTARSWPDGTGRFEARNERADELSGSGRSGRVFQWDALSDGEDPSETGVDESDGPAAQRR